MRTRGLCAFGLCALLLARAKTTHAEPTRGDDEHALPTEVVVSGARAPRGLSQIERREDELERDGQSNVAESLERLPAVHAAQDDRGERQLVVRGIGQRGVVALLDGVPLAVPYDGQLDLAKVPIDAVERVLLVHGAAPVLYGPNGTGGSLHIQTRTPTRTPMMRTRTEFARFGTRASSAFTARTGPGDRLGIMLAAGYENLRYLPLADHFPKSANQTGSRRDNSDRAALSAHAKLSYELSPRDRISLHTSHIYGQYGVPPATHDFLVRNWRWSDWRSHTVALKHSHNQQHFSAESHIYASFFGNTLDAYDDARLRTQLRPKSFQSIYDDHTLGLSVRTRAALGRAQISSLSSVRRDHHTGIADRGAAPVAADSNLLTTSLLLDAALWPERLQAQLGAQLDGELPDKPSRGPAARPSLSASPLAGVSYRHGGLSLALNASMRSRVPTLRERFSAVFGTRVPNPTLAPERAQHLAFDAGYQLRNLRLDGALFVSMVRDLVSDVIIGPGLSQMQNVDQARLCGFEARAQWQPARALQLHGAWLQLWAKRLDGEITQLAYRPRFKGVFSAIVTPHPRLSLSATLRSIGRQDYQNPNNSQWETLAGYTLIDARVQLRVIDALQLHLRVDNLLGSYAEGRYSFPEAGRQLWLGASSALPW